MKKLIFLLPMIFVTLIFPFQMAMAQGPAEKNVRGSCLLWCGLQQGAGSISCGEYSDKIIEGDTEVNCAQFCDAITSQYRTVAEKAPFAAMSEVDDECESLCGGAGAICKVPTIYPGSYHTRNCDSICRRIGACVLGVVAAGKAGEEFVCKTN